MNTQLRSVALERGDQLIATQAGVRNMTGVRSVIPQPSRGAVESVNGVHAAYLMTMLPFIYEREDARAPSSSRWSIRSEDGEGGQCFVTGRYPSYEGSGYVRS